MVFFVFALASNPPLDDLTPLEDLAKIAFPLLPILILASMGGMVGGATGGATGAPETGGSVGVEVVGGAGATGQKAWSAGAISLWKRWAEVHEMCTK